MVELLRLAHERACEGQLATELEALLAKRKLPDLNTLRARFAPDAAKLPQVCVRLPSLAEYEQLAKADVMVAA